MAYFEHEKCSQTPVSYLAGLNYNLLKVNDKVDVIQLQLVVSNLKIWYFTNLISFKYRPSQNTVNCCKNNQ